MRFNFLIIFFLTVKSVEISAQKVKYKFQLFDAFDSTLINPERIIIKPRISERAYHNNKKGHNKIFLNSSKILFNTNDSSFTFEYDEMFYQYRDVFLNIQSAEYYFTRPDEYDYDESDCINLRTHTKFFLFPFRYFTVKQGNLKLKPEWCLTLILKKITEEGDTIFCIPMKRECIDTLYEPSFINGNFVGNSIMTNDNNSHCYLDEQFTLDFSSKYLLSIDICNGFDCYYTDFDLFETREFFQTVFLDKLTFNYLKLEEEIENCSDARGQNCFSKEDVIQFKKPKW